MHDPLEGDRLDRYLAGTLGPEEAKRVRAFLDAETGRRGVMAGVYAWMRGEDLGAVPYDVNASLRALAVQIDTVRYRSRDSSGELVDSERAYRRMLDHHRPAAVDPTVPGMRGVGRQPLRWGIFKAQPLRRWLWPTLATLVVGVVVTVAGWNAGVHHLSRYEAASTLTYVTENGQRATITLPDGSTVALNVASRLDVPADYVAGHHTVRLMGEALFTVTNHEGTPFTVIAGTATARVLGTSFVVRNYPTDTAATVAVHDGKVSVRSVVLTAAHQVTVNNAGRMHVGSADLSQFSFATGVLTFDGVPLREAIAMLDRWFDADIRLGDSTLGMQQLSGRFTAGSLSGLIESLELSFNVRVVREGRVVTVYPR